jgi:RNA polymerase sigma-70 factor (ECF subfamily)
MERPVSGQGRSRSHDQLFGSQPPRLSLVDPSAGPAAAGQLSEASAQAHEIDWSILMARAQAGDAQAYCRLLKEITPYLRFLVGRRSGGLIDVEDAVQDTLLTVHAIRHTYDPTRSFKPWLAAIANRRMIDQLRRQRRQRARETPLKIEHETFPAFQTNLPDEMSEPGRLAAAIETLPAGERVAIHLLKLREMSLKEAAAKSGMSIVALKVATHRAVKRLRGILSGRSGKS